MSALWEAVSSRQDKIGGDQNPPADVGPHEVKCQLPWPLTQLSRGAPDDPGCGALQPAV